MENTVLKKNYRGLEKGTEFVYNTKLDSWVFQKREEEIADSSIRESRIKVQFSNAFVQNNPEIFEVPGQDEKKQKQIEELSTKIANLQKELKELKK